MVHSNGWQVGAGYWQEASVSHQIGLSRELFEAS